MTEERMALLELIEKGAEADLVRELLACAGERPMAAEVDQLTGAAAGARSPGRIELAIPKLRKGSYFPAFLEESIRNCGAVAGSRCWRPIE